MRVRRGSIAVAAALSLMSVTITRGQNANLPPQAASQSEIQVEGELEVLVEDHADRAILRHFLVTPAARLQLQVPPGLTELEGLTSGTRVRARGRMRQSNVLELSPNDGSVSTLALASPNTFGEQRVIVILVNFTDTTAPYSWTTAQDVTFNKTNSFFQENSYGQTWLTGDVYGWYTIPMTKAGCDYNQIASLADQAATAQGVNLANYTRRVYAFPTNGCSWWGLGSVGGNPSRAWVKGSFQLKVVAHELGHNFGDYHAKSEPCDSNGCSLIEYGDDRDIMGQSGVGHLNAFQKERLGWLGYGSSPAIQSVTAGGTFWVESLQTSGTAAKALKILKSSTSSSRTYYYVESRSQLGFDGNYSPGVILHTGVDTNGNSSQQVDLERVTSSFDSVLNVGQTFTDALAGLAITTISSDLSGSWVSVDYAGAPCSASAPTLSASPSGTIATAPSTSVALSINVRNNDSSSCAPANFAVATGVPAGWSWAGPSSLVVAPGATGSLALTVTPDGTEGGWDIPVQFSRAAGAGATALSRIVVASALGVSLTAVGGTNYQVSATVTLTGLPAAGVPVSFSIRDPKGAVTFASATTNGNGVATIKGRLKGKAPRGTYTVTANAASGALTGTATTTFVY